MHVKPINFLSPPFIYHEYSACKDHCSDYELLCLLFFEKCLIHHRKDSVAHKKEKQDHEVSRVP